MAPPCLPVGVLHVALLPSRVPGLDIRIPLRSLDVSSRSMVTEIVHSCCSSSSYLYSSSNCRSVVNEGGDEARGGTGSYASRLTVIGRKIAAQLGSSTEQSGRSSWSGVELIPTKCAPHTSNHSCC